MARLAEAGQPKGHILVVADETGETKRLRALKAEHKGLSFIGLGEALFPALVSRRSKALFRPLPRQLKCHSIVLIFATPRSGSSLVADVVSDLGYGDVREHLRDGEIQVLSSGYNFNRRTALRNLVNLSGKNGCFSTKIISHFLMDYLRRVRDFKSLEQFGDDIKVHAIVLDRSNKVDQAVSADLAMQRGVWHVRSGKDAAKIKETRAARYEFGRLNARFFEYWQQSFILDFARRIFPDHMPLNYEKDVEHGDVEALGKRINEAFDLGVAEPDFSRSKARKKIANKDNSALVKKFRGDFWATFGYKPK